MADRIVIGGGARCGTTLLNTILGYFPGVKEFYNEIPVPLLREEKEKFLNSSIAWAYNIDTFNRFLEEEDFIAHQKENPDKDIFVYKWPSYASSSILAEFVIEETLTKFIYIIRDGRNAVVSEYAQEKRYIISPGKWIAMANLFNFLVHRNKPNVHLLYYEDLLQSPHLEIKRLEKFIGREIDPNWVDFHNSYPIDKIVEEIRIHRTPLPQKPIAKWKHKKHRKRLRELLEWAVTKEEDLFTETDCTIVSFSNWLIKLGYEQNHDWLDELCDLLEESDVQETI